MDNKKSIYRVIFYNNGNSYELYARSVSQSGMIGFIEVEELMFGESSTVLVDPAEERMKTEFSGVRRCYLPHHLVVRIDEVEKQGKNKIKEITGKSDKVTPFPSPYSFTTEGK